ncbi:MAG: sulfatase [Myxococcota bacterium]
MTLASRPLILEPQSLVDAHEPDVTVTLDVPEDLRGLPGLLSIVARPLSPSPVVRKETREFEIPEHARLYFGYGVDEAGWINGWPPVLFRVRSRDATGELSPPLFERRVDPAGEPRDRQWFDASVGLEDLEGRRVHFVFEAEALAGAPGVHVAHSFPVVSNPELRVARASATEMPRSIVLVSLDTLRAQNVSAYGYARRTMPALERRLVARGAMMRSAVAPVPFTPPSHMSMLTGVEPCVHGVSDQYSTLRPGLVTLAEVLRDAGYRTAAFTEDAYLVAGAGFERGFDRYFEERSEESAAPGFLEETFGAAADWLRTHASSPFFLFVHTYSVHAPHSPPRGYQTLFRDDGGLGYPPKHRDAALRYDQEIRYTDDILAELLDALETQSFAKRTIVVVTSDHGEGFGEHYLTGHGFGVFDTTMRVPLVFRAPGLIPPGRVIDEQVSLVDLMPTLLELVEVPVPAQVQGHSFASRLLGREDGFEERPLVVRAGAVEGVRARRYKYIHRPGRGDKKSWEALYLIEEDPGERRNVLGEYGELVEEARRILARDTESCAASRAAAAEARGAEARIQKQPAWFIDREEIARKLRSLGYLE